jgi:hypothetical protein
MSRKYPKKVRKEFAAKLKAAEAFVESWTTSELAALLITDYGCTLGCQDAKTFAGIFSAFGYPNYAECILADHGEDCDNPHYHEPQGVWTFDLTAFGRYRIGDWTVVADGKDGADAEERAKEFVRNRLKDQYASPIHVRVNDVENGTPSSMALYNWTDIRKAA